jgi:hypothetical protein
MCIFLKNDVCAVAKMCEFVKFQKKEVQKFDFISSLLCICELSWSLSGIITSFFASKADAKI